MIDSKYDSNLMWRKRGTGSAWRAVKKDDINERRHKILQFIQNNQIATITDICNYFSASESTIRRDIEWLEKNSKIGRHHGSIYNLNGQYDMFDIRNRRFVEEKQRIGEYAASLVSGGELIYVEAGSTMRQFALSLVARQDLHNVTVVSAAPNVAAIIAADNRFKVLMLPGILRSLDEKLEATGEMISSLQKFSFSKCFSGASGIMPKRGVLMPANHFAETSRAAYEQSSEVIVLADHSKFSNQDPYVVCSLDKINMIICDKHPDVEAVMKKYHCEEYMKLIHFV